MPFAWVQKCWNELQHKAKQDLISISKKISKDILVIEFFCRKVIALPQTKFDFFLAFK